MLLFIVGGALALLGLVSALLLVAAPLGLTAATPGLTLWILFPLFTLVGYGLMAVGSRDPAVKAPTKLIAVPLLLVALLAATGLMADAAGIMTIGTSSAPLWYVLALGGVLGAVGTAASGTPASRSA